MHLGAIHPGIAHTWSAASAKFDQSLTQGRADLFAFVFLFLRYKFLHRALPLHFGLRAAVIILTTTVVLCCHRRPPLACRSCCGRWRQVRRRAWTTSAVRAFWHLRTYVSHFVPLVSRH